MGNISVFMLSHLSDKAVGAVGIANQIIGMLSIIYSIISMGTAILVTQYLGSEKTEMANKVSKISILLSLISGFIFSLILILFGKSLLIVMNLPEEMLPYGTMYIRTVGGTSFLMSAITSFSTILRSYGHTKLPMHVALLMNLMNVLGNYISLFKPFGIPVLGVEGVALSSIISNLTGVMIIGYVTFKELKIKLTYKNITKTDIPIIKLILKVGGPAAGEYISYSFSQIVVTYIITNLGTSSINTRIYLQNLTSFVNILSFSIGQGSQILMGYKKGAGKLDEMHIICIKSLKLGIICNFTLSVVFYIFGSKLLGIFTSDISIIELGSKILLIDMFLEIGRAINHTVGNSLRGTGDVKYPVVISIFSMWGICVLFSLMFGINLKIGLTGIWFASSLDEWFRGLVLLKRWYSKKWCRIQLV
jgi:putative efflux protein, MATE family